MMKQSWLKQQETLQVAREKAKAELQLLKSQIHPHFLFNTLNNVYFLTLTASQKAPEMLEKLTDMLRYILNECNRSYVPLEKEIKMIEDYMALEKIRYGDRLKMDLEIKGDYKNKMISPLLLIPLVENSFKHGASKMLQHPWVSLNVTVEGQYLFLLLSNSRPEETILQQHNGHIGLNNVKKRLQLLYPTAHELSIVNGTDSYEVFMKIDLGKAGELIEGIDVKKESVSYELA
jgi:LytS/YehU family sensor histidine kinase